MDPAYLLDSGDKLGDVFDADRILNSQAMGLTFHTGFVDEDSTVSCQPCNIGVSQNRASTVKDVNELTCERDTNMIIQHGNFPHRPRILQL